MADPQASYQTLLDKIEELGRRQKARFGEQIRCRRGCYACCHPPDSLFRIEGEALQRVVAALPAGVHALVAAQLDAYEAGQRLLCPLLDEDDDGRCLAYDGRPAICRTQGHALWLRHDEDAAAQTGADGAMSWCELNFTEETPTRDDAFDVERLNVMMSLITQLSTQDAPRVGLVPLLREALQGAPKEPAP